jgi:rRNA pseudouridine-1189 N-methylase Emg1 (Nep1/Mra1 family)
MSTDVPNASARSSSQVAERMRLYRNRRRQGLRSVRILLPVTDIDYFMRVVLTKRQRQRPDALETALVGLFQDMLEEIRA